MWCGAVSIALILRVKYSYGIFEHFSILFCSLHPCYCYCCGYTDAPQDLLGSYLTDIDSFPLFWQLYFDYGGRILLCRLDVSRSGQYRLLYALLRRTLDVIPVFCAACCVCWGYAPYTVRPTSHRKDMKKKYKIKIEFVRFLLNKRFLSNRISTAFILDSHWSRRNYIKSF